MVEDVDDVEARQASSLRDKASRVFVAGAAILLAFVLRDVFAPPTTGRLVMLSTDIGQCLCFLAGALTLRRRPLTLARSHALIYALVALGVANAELSAWILSDAREMAFVAMYLIGMGSLLTERTATMVASTLVAGSSIVVAYVLPEPGSTLFIGTSSLAGLVIGATLFIGREESDRREAHSRQRERDQAAALRSELEERTRAEAERERLAARKAELESQLRQAQKLEALGTLAGGIAHDLNNVLASIVGVAEVAAEEQPEGSQEREDFGAIVGAAQRGATLTRNLLGFAQRGKHRHEPFSLNSTIETIAVVVERTAPRHVVVMLDLDDQADTVEGDPNQIGHVIMNLCVNAIDAMPHGGTLTIETRTEMVDSARFAVLRVRDTGLGMDAATQARAFEPFFTTKADAGGSGLGLPMVYGTIKEHRGSVTIESTLGAGTTIVVRLPLAAAAVPRGPSTSGSMRKVADAAPPPILVIDDDADVRRVFRRMLGGSAEIIEASSGAEGIERYASMPGDQQMSLVILDLAMPGMTGAECFARLRALDATVPIAIVSGFPKDQHIAPLLASGNAEFLAKPFQREDLVSLVERMRRA